MTLQVPITLTGTDINLTVVAPFTAPIPTIPKGRWLSLAERAQKFYPDATITDNSSGANFLYPGPSAVFYYQIDPEHQAAYSSSSASIVITGDYLSVGNSYITSLYDGLYSVTIPNLVTDTSAVDPKIRILIHNTTESFLASPEISLVTLNPNMVVRDDLGVLVNTENPVYVRKGTTEHFVKLTSTSRLYQWRKGPAESQSVSPYLMTIRDIEITSTGYVYRVGMKYSTEIAYGTAVEILAFWHNDYNGPRTSVWTIADNVAADNLVELPSTWKPATLTTDTGISYNVLGSEPTDKVPYNVISAMDYSLGMLAVRFQQPPMAIQSANALLIPLQVNARLIATIRTTATGPLKDEVALSYVTYDELDGIIQSVFLTWNDCLALCNNTSALTLLVEGITPAKIVLTSIFGAPVEKTLTFALKFELYGASVVTGSEANFNYMLQPALGNDRTPVTYSVSSNYPSVLDRLVFDPDGPLTFDPAKGTTLTFTTRHPTIQEILDAID